MKDGLSSFLPGNVDTLTVKEPAPQSTPQNERLVSLAGRQDRKSVVFGKTDRAWITGHRYHLDCSLFHSPLRLVRQTEQGSLVTGAT